VKRSSSRWIFLGAKEFKGEGLDRWQLSSMTRSDQMFDGATSFNKDLCVWKVRVCIVCVFNMKYNRFGYFI